MNQNEQGVLYPFRLSGSRMRQGAVMLRRQGRALDALSLLWRAAEQDDTPAAWQALATELRALGNWEVAVPLLARVLSRDAHQPGAWVDMGRCLQALGRPDAALDCAYHQLQEDPWSREGDAARALLAELDMTSDEKEPHRTRMLIQRGIFAWQSGNRALGEKCIRRAVRMSNEKEHLLITSSMMCMMEADFEGALKYLSMALRVNPYDSQALTALSALYQQMGKRRIARGFLKQAGKYAVSVQEEDGFLTAAWAQDAWPQLQAYLDERMKRQPYRKALLSAKAQMCCEQGDLSAAMQLWKIILAIDPDDRHAAIMPSVAQKATWRLLGMQNLFPPDERKKQVEELRRAAESEPIAALLRPGSRSRRLIDWMIGSIHEDERELAKKLLEENSSDAAVIAYLKELLCLPFLRGEVRQWALIRLAEAGCRDEMLIMTGGRFSVIACQKVESRKDQHPWRMFLPMLLAETRQYRQSSEIAEFAAEIWQALPLELRLKAATTQRYAWCKALEVLYLRMAGEEKSAARAVKDAALSVRKISRVLRKIGRCMTAEPVTE